MSRYFTPIISLTLALLSSSLSVAGDDPYFHSKGSWAQTYEDQWGLKRIGIDPARPLLGKNTGKRVIIAIIDSGLDYFHLEIGDDTVWKNPGETPNGIDDDNNGYVDDLIGWNFVEKNNNPWDWLGHGTHVTGIIAALSENDEGIAGVNPDALIMPLRVMNMEGRGYSTRIAKAIYYAVANGAQIINLSMAINERSPQEMRAIAYAYKKGVVVIASSGNNGEDTTAYGPASYDNVITVGSSTPENKHASFSNWGSAVDIAAPGVDILSLRAARTDLNRSMRIPDYEPGQDYIGEHADYYRTSGTSFSAAFVSGVASLLLTKYTDATPDDIKRLLLQSSRDIDVPGVDQNTGYGLLDAKAALGVDFNYYVDAAIEGVTVIMKGKQPFVQVNGMASADQLKHSWIEIGMGKNPSSWQQATDKISKSIPGGIVAEIDAMKLQKAKQWTLRLIVEHKNGKRREARFILSLG